jgi:hypothetical protein
MAATVSSSSGSSAGSATRGGVQRCCRWQADHRAFQVSKGRCCIGNEGLLAAAAGVPAIVESAGARFAWEELFAGPIRHGHTCLAYERCGGALSRLSVRARAGVEDYYPTRPRSHGVKLMFEITSVRGIYIPAGPRA